MPSAFEYPEMAEDLDSAIIAVNMQLLPFVLGAVANLQDRKFWQTDDDWLRASESIGAFLECSMVACLSDLLGQGDRLYRLVDSGLNGTVYTASGDPVVVTPEIGDVPPTESVLPGMIARLDHVEIMLDALPGVITPGWFGIGGDKATLADVVKALRVGSGEQATAAIDTFQEMLGAAGNTATIADSLIDLFTGSVEAVEEGGMLIVLAAGIVGTLASMQGLSFQLTALATQNARIIQTLDGGGGIGPSDNILQALRGTTVASDERNVIDSIVAALALVSVDNPDVLAKLEEIRELLA